MQVLRDRCKAATLVILTILVSLVGIYSLIKTVSNGCVMTYMYPTYIPISTQDNLSSAKYGLYLYHEGWKKIDFVEHLKKLVGVPVLFIPGNGGSYKQVRSLAAESDRAFQGGPLERTYYQEASVAAQEGGLDMDAGDLQLPNRYSRRLDWFAVDLEGEHSAMDGRILEEHTEYVVYAIHRILDQYKESHDARAKEGAASSGSLPKSVILVGHSMGGFVARAAVVHPDLRKSAVETVLTLSSAHQSPPLALQPSLGHYYARVNQEWRKGYEIQTTHVRQHSSDPALSRVVVISITGGINDYQVRSKLESLENIVPPTHGFTISSTGMKNVWLSMEHQAILWCNQLAVQVSHTLLSLIDSKTGQPFPESRKRLAIFTRMLQSGAMQSFRWMTQLHMSAQSNYHLLKPDQGPQVPALPSCPNNVHWTNDGLEKDLYILTTTVTILAMDGRRRWLDIKKLGSDGRNHFILVTNLLPCSGVRIHLWPKKGEFGSDLPLDKRALEVTSKMVHIPSGPAPRQIEPGSQTEQAPPSAVFLLGPEDMLGFRFLTISVAPRPSVSGRPPPAASMAVGQFFNPREGQKEFSPLTMLFSSYSPKDLFMKEDHPLPFNLSFRISLGLFPVALTLKTAGCGIKSSELNDEGGEQETSKLCKLRCFPPVALAWDTTSGLHVYPNLYSETITVDSAPALWSSDQGSEKTIVLLLVDPHCSYRSSFAVSFTAAAGRFLLLYSSKIVAFSIAVIFFALMHQAHAWDLDLPIPSILIAVQSNLRMPLPFSHLMFVPILFSLLLSILADQSLPPLVTFIAISTVCYLLANGFMIILISVSQGVFYVAALVHVFIRTRWQLWEGNHHAFLIHWFINLSSGFLSLKVVRLVRMNPPLVTTLVAIPLVCLVHPALGLFVLLSSHALSCHLALCSFFIASFRSHPQRREHADDLKRESDGAALRTDHNFNGDLLLEANYSSSPGSARSFVDTQLENFNHRHGLAILHLLAALMFVPSLAAWWQRIGMGQSLPWFIDSTLCLGVILHSVCNSKPENNSFFLSILGIPFRELRMYHVYQFAGYYAFLSGLALAPYRVFYAMATIGTISFVLTILRWRGREKGEAHTTHRKHSHRH